MDKSIIDTSLDSLPWKDFQIKLFQLQCRIYRTMQIGNIQDTVRFQKILLKTKSAYLMAFWQIVTEKKLYEVDNKSFLNSNEEIMLLRKMQNNVDSNENSEKKTLTLYKREKEGFQISTIENEVKQRLWKYALEPTYKSYFVTNSYGFRSYENIFAVQKEILFRINKLREKENKKIVSITIDPSLNKADFHKVVKDLIFPAKEKLKLIKNFEMGWKNKIFFKLSERNFVSLLLINVALQGIENVICENGFICGIRYDYNVFYIIENNENENILLIKIKQFLNTKGFNLNSQKIKIAKLSDGFDFLHWHFTILTNNKVINYPSKNDWINYKNKIKSTLKNSRYPLYLRIEKINKISKEWFYYHKYCDLSEITLELYSLKVWSQKYLKSKTKMTTKQINYSLEYTFKNYFVFA